MAAAASFRALLLLILFPSFCLVSLIIMHPVLASVTCIKEEQDALIEFKTHLRDPGKKLSSWVGEDCCAWRGIGCNIRTGHVTQLNLRGNMEDYNTLLRGEVSSSLLHLKHLMSLDLSRNGFNLAPIPEFFGSFQQLRYLNLSGSYLGREIPHDLGNLSKLQYLDLRGHLELSKPINLPPSLIELYLDYTSINGATFTVSTNLTSSSLKVLHISAADSITSLFPKWLFGLNSLTSLILNLGIRSTIPAWFCTLGNLKHLDMSGNYLEGRIPDCFANLSHLIYLDLSDNSLSGILPSNIGQLTSLEVLDLSDNSLSGILPSNIGQLTSLEVLDLSHNHLNGSVPTSFGNLCNLKNLSLDSNNLTGSIPESLGMLSHLENLGVSNNYLEGNVNETLFTNLSHLQSLDMSETSLVWNVSSDWNPPFQLIDLRLSPSLLGPRFPTWILTQTSLKILNISKASIEDVVPNNFWNFSSSLRDLDISHNKLRGQLPDVLNINYFRLSHNCFKGPVLMNISAYTEWVDMSSNLISGNISIVINKSDRESYLSVLNLSNNSITGHIPVSLCGELSIRAMLLSMNQFSGTIPDCWLSNENLEYLDLSRNNLVGEIPTTFGNLSNLVSLHLSNNNLTGEISLTLLARLPSWLQVIDLGGNKLIGRIPSNLKDKFPHLTVLRLRSNMLYGNIPRDISHFISLQVLDLAQNNLSGNIPKSFKNFNAMKVVWDKRRERTEFITLGSSYYEEKVMVATKGGEWEFKVIKNILSSIDLSQNNLSGEIPDGLMNLVGLINVDLSKNHLTGKIPVRIGNLKQLASLDLSQNQLYGKIPDSLSTLNFLAYMNLSYNNLSGMIPQGSQIQTLDNPSIYVGNIELCGRPTRKQCEEDETPSHPFGPGGNNMKEVDYDDDNDQMVFLYISVALGFIVGLWGVFVVFLFSNPWRIAYYRFLDVMEDKIVVVVLIQWAKIWKVFFRK